MRRRQRVVVVGGGWAGCAAAAALAAAGAEVTLHEAASELGGRARRVELDLDGVRHRLDNGQHLMLGAYQATARLLNAVGVDLTAAVERRPFELCYADGYGLRATRAPAPWHLLGGLVCARGMALPDRVALARFVQRLKARDWLIGDDRTAAAWLAEQGQSEALVRRIWRPLAIAALNTPLAEASAQILVNVLRDSIGTSASACELWLPRSDLSALLPEAVARYVVARGGAVRCGSRVERIARGDARFTVFARDGEHFADAVIYAAPPAQLASVASALSEALHDAIAPVTALVYQPICTVYLKYDPTVALPRTFIALLDDPAAGAFGQWAFDRGALDPAHRGVLAVVISADGPHRALTINALEAAVAQQLARETGIAHPRAARTIVEKRATLKVVPGLQRPRNGTSIPGFALAGDWTHSDYPSTLESAVRSGEAAARLVLA